MNAILIDDEQLMLDLLQAQIAQLSDIEVLGAFTNPHQGLIEVSKQQPNVVFLDISMPEVSGLELARQLKSAIPEIKIVFLTAFEEYALEAFEIQVDDYILKPVEDARLQRTIAKLLAERETQGEVYQPMIGCFQKLNFRYYGATEDKLEINWRTSKAREIGRAHV